ncbi:uncharacterized protein DUF4124 [Pseudomonas duriflava]|uniref:Uncharacterized protein DUF4124 n=1 Tax=Pseudomonas duriflava TaxID=459528 RepID=A0A562Q2I8_9PSED|nr:DUF4124 domain-containing protein [Pseudomonas duriflava]TWI50895.1 uncharacterized protein DUF4124 [Pseudomonas duriflava]
MWRTLLAISSTLLMIGSIEAAQVYKWVDAQGVTHFSAQPPTTGEADALTLKPAPGISGSSGSSSGADAVNNPQQQIIDQKIKQEIKQTEKQREDYCKSARTNLAQLRNNPRVMVEAGRGEMRRLTEEERQQRISETEFAIHKNCD